MTRRRLDAELVRRGLVESRSLAAEAVRCGQVLVGGAIATNPARQVASDESLRVTASRPRFVSRGGEKLDAALETFSLDMRDRRALDAGASTGGFTDCLLQRGIREVVAVDVGRGQIAWNIRTDPRVTVLERTNVRAVTPDQLGGPVDVVVADLSFISLLTVAPALVACSTDDADFVLLVKPQFEAGRDRVGKGGIVREPEVRADVLRRVARGLSECGIPVVDARCSPLRGADGNVEFMVHCRADGTGLTDERLDALGRAVPT